MGEKTVTTSDPLGRPIRVEVFSAGNTSVHVITTGYSADHNSVTVTNGTGTNAIATTTYTDTQGEPVLNIGYPTNGTIEYSWQQYDADGNRIAQQQLSSSSGVITTWATNAWTYDGLNRVATETSKDGAVTTYSYDALGDVTNRAMPGGLTWSASYLSDGRIASEQEHGGSLTTRTNSYTYFGAGSSFAGLLKTRVDGRGTLTSNISYDAFLRRTDMNTFGSAPEQNFYRHFQYDAVGNAVWMYEAAHYIQFSSVQTVRYYDAYNHVNDEYTEVDRSTDSSYWESFQSWDSAGRRAYLQTGIGMNFGYRADGLMTQANSSTFSYANNGLPVSRTTGAKTATVNQRDGRGRVLQATTTYNTSPILTENLSYRNDGRLNSYTASRDFTDSRSYSYSSLANRVTQESFGLSSGHSATNTYTIDSGATGGLGILTAATETGGAAGSWTVPTSGGLDGLSRVAQAQDSLVRRSTIGTALGAATLSATLDGNPLNLEFDGYIVTYRSGIWRADMDLSPGSHTLNVSAVDPTGYIFGSTNSTFSVATNAGDKIQNTYDGNGNVTTRVWVNALNQTNRTQSLTWDAFDRLVVVNQRDTNGNGFDWTACYDSLGRRIETTCDMVLTNVEVQGPSVTDSTIDSWYDPQVEFEEVGVQVDGLGYWKTLGPDVNGVYGGMQGVGGLESIMEDGHLSAVGVVQDYFGNVLGTITEGSLTWNSSRFSSYGPVPGYQSPALSPEVGLAQSLGWRGKRVDETGLFHLGARHYDPVAGRFLNADPLGHSASMDLYSFCGGDPVNSFDPDGRLSSQFYQNLNAQAQGPVNMVNLFGANAGNVNVSQFLAYGNQNPNAQIVGNDLGSQFAQLGQAQAQGYQGSSAFFGSDMNYVDANGFSHVSFCMSCHDPTDPVAMLNNQAAFNTVNTSIPAFVAQNALALIPGEGIVGDAAPAVNAMTQGVDYEAQRLAALGLTKNTTVFQPTAEQVDSAAFQVIVGPPQYTASGDLVGTISDSAANGGLLEIKGGSSTLNSSYQLRLQTYNSVVNNIPMTIETTRPVNPTFMNYLQNWGVTVKPPGTP